MRTGQKNILNYITHYFSNKKAGDLFENIYKL